MPAHRSMIFLAGKSPFDFLDGITYRPIPSHSIPSHPVRDEERASICWFRSCLLFSRTEAVGTLRCSTRVYVRRVASFARFAQVYCRQSSPLPSFGLLLLCASEPSRAKK